ncbi:hypothetical protein THAOC_07227, partial [Thalassiosira oceanica]
MSVGNRNLIGQVAAWDVVQVRAVKSLFLPTGESSELPGDQQDDGPLPIRGGYLPASETGERIDEEGSDLESNDGSGSSSEYDAAAMNADYAADRQVRDEEQAEEEEEMKKAAKIFPADKESEPVVFTPPEVFATLDIDDEEEMDNNAEDSELSSNERPKGIMQAFLYEVHQRIREEVKSTSRDQNNWLLRHLRGND